MNSDSTLTKILMSSLGGNCRTSLLLAASPSADNITESTSTLRFGERAKKIKTAVKANEKKSQEALQKQVQALLAEVARLKAYIAELEKAVGDGRTGSLDTEELLRTAAATAGTSRAGVNIGELLLLESNLAEEKETQKMLELQLREAQAETQAAEADLQPLIRRADEAEEAATKAQKDADELIAEMQRYVFADIRAIRLIAIWIHVWLNLSPARVMLAWHGQSSRQMRGLQPIWRTML